MIPRRRSGFSLLEVLLATSILLGCVITLGELASIGSRSAIKAKELAQAQLLCQSRMNRILAGILPLESVEDEPLENAPDWLVTVQAEPVPAKDLLAVRVTVEQQVKEHQQGQSYTLVRWVNSRLDSSNLENRQLPEDSTLHSVGPRSFDESHEQTTFATDH